MNSAPTIERRPLTLLLVEDDDGDAESVVRTFEAQCSQIRVVRATDGVDALALLRDRDARSLLGQRCLLMVDVNLPRMSGIELVAQVRQDPALRHFIVFVFTASMTTSDKIKAYELNVAGYVVKPSDGQEPRSLVALIDAYRDVIELPPRAWN
jgi:CheY-like chemotaxis protein